MADLIPFGKYKNQPLTILEQDPGYCTWLLQQDWLASRYPGIHTLIINNFGGPEETPEHNRLQLRLLDDDFRGKVTGLIQHRIRPIRQWTAHADVMPWEVLSGTKGVVRTSLLCRLGVPEFEVNGIDAVWVADYWTLHWCLVRRTVWSSLGQQRNAAVEALAAEWKRQVAAWKQTIRSTDDKDVRGQTEDALASWYSQHGVSYADAYFSRMYITVNGQQERFQSDDIACYRVLAHREIDPQYQAVADYLTQAITAEIVWWHPEANPFVIAVECKPTLGDDYPAVLRFIKRARPSPYMRRHEDWETFYHSHDHTLYPDGDGVARAWYNRTPMPVVSVLLVEELTQRGGTAEEVRAFFLASGVLLLLTSEVEAFAGSGMWTPSAVQQMAELDRLYSQFCLAAKQSNPR